MRKSVRNRYAELVERSRAILEERPNIGRKRLAQLIRISPHLARRLIEWRRGEKDGHSADPEYRRVRKLKDDHPDWGSVRIGRELSLGPNLVEIHLCRYHGANAKERFRKTDTAPAKAKQCSRKSEELQDTNAGQSRDLAYKGHRITSLAALLEHAEVDLEEWEVDRHVINKWEVGAMDRSTGQIETTPLFQIKVWLKRRAVAVLAKELLTGMLHHFKHAGPGHPRQKKSKTRSGVLEISIMDLHLGKFAAAAEVGKQYDPETTESMFWNAFNNLLERSSACNPATVLFPVGNDFFNVDGHNNCTTSGTPQDEAVRWQESFVRGKALLVKAIDRLAALSTVDVVVVTGNHDTQRAYYLGEVLNAWYSRSKSVTVENSPTQRKYYKFGKCLIGFTHGHNEKHDRLPLLMATERADDWAKCRHREWHLGHFHTRLHKMFIPSADHSGVLVRILPSLCPPDAWHQSMGYSSKLAADAYYWDSDDGCVANFTHSPA